MDDKKTGPTWNGRKVAKESHIPDLEAKAAQLEFKNRMSKEDAEQRTHHTYKQEQHRLSAAHHLAGLKAAQAAGSHEEGHKHGILYAEHLKQLGLDPMGPVPDEIKSLVEKQDKFYRFKSHQGDNFLLDSK